MYKHYINYFIDTYLIGLGNIFAQLLRIATKHQTWCPLSTQNNVLPVNLLDSDFWGSSGVDLVILGTPLLMVDKRTLEVGLLRELRLWHQSSSLF